MKALIIRPGAAPEVVEVEPDKLDLKFLQSVVEGYIEPIWRGEAEDGPSWVMYGNEESKIFRMASNPVATEVAEHFGWTGPLAGDYVAGPVIVLGTNEDADEDAGEQYYADVPEGVVAYARQQAELFV